MSSVVVVVEFSSWCYEASCIT